MGKVLRLNLEDFRVIDIYTFDNPITDIVVQENIIVVGLKNGRIDILRIVKQYFSNLKKADGRSIIFMKVSPDH